LKRKKNQNSIGVKFFSGLFFIAGVGILVWIGLSLGKEAYRKRQIQNEIGGLQKQIEQMKQDNSDLTNLVSYLSTSQFQEKEARTKLDLQKNDEKMIVLRKSLDPQLKNSGASQDSNQIVEAPNAPNWQKWLGFFFSQKN